MKTTKRTKSRVTNRRASPEAVEKRRVARLFNTVLSGKGSGPVLDGRTEKRRKRLLAELERGMKGRSALKPLDVLQRVHELLELGEPLAKLRKVAKVRVKITEDEALVDVVRRLHEAYAFRPEAYRFVGVSEDLLRAASVIPTERGRRVKRG